MSNYAVARRTDGMVAHNMVTTQFELDGFRVTRTLGVVRGITVRSRSIFGTIGAGLQTHCRRQHHSADQSMREDASRSVRLDVATRGGNRRQCRCRRSL